MAQVDEYAKAFLKIKEELDDIEKAYNENKRRKDLVDLKERLEGWFAEFLTSTGQMTAVTPHGTVHWNTRNTAVLEDPDAFMRHVIGTGEYELIERRAAAVACRDFAEKNGTLPPGVRLNVKRSISVNKPGAKAKAAALASM